MPPDCSVEARRLRALSDLNRRLIHPVDLRGLFDHALWHAADLLGAEAGTLRLLDGHGCLVCAATYNAPDGYLDAHLRLRPESPELTYALEATGPVAFGPELTYPALTALMPAGHQGSILAPVAVEGVVLGMLTLVLAAPRELEEGEFLALRAITELVGVGELNARSFSSLERTSRTDLLTGLSTRRHFEELLRRELARARRQDRPLSLAMMDVDRLKWINDTWGHVTGDRVLASIGSLLQNLRATDVAARLGGDEFAILMPDTSARDAAAVCERFTQGLDELNAKQAFPFPLTVSVGIREMAFPEEDLVAAADAAMYRHKRQARLEGPRHDEAHPLEDEEEAARSCRPG